MSDYTYRPLGDYTGAPELGNETDPGTDYSSDAVLVTDPPINGSAVGPDHHLELPDEAAAEAGQANDAGYVIEPELAQVVAAVPAEVPVAPDVAVPAVVRKVAYWLFAIAGFVNGALYVAYQTLNLPTPPWLAVGSAVLAFSVSAPLIVAVVNVPKQTT